MVGGEGLWDSTLGEPIQFSHGGLHFIRKLNCKEKYFLEHVCE